MTQLASKSSASPFHKGEITLQRSVGMAERMEKFGSRVIRDHMPDQHREFFARLPFMVAATVDPAGQVWPTILTGKPGFMQSPEPKSLTINATSYPGDPAAAGMQKFGAIGMLGIELHSRRRNRLNGTIRQATNNALDIKVGHSFGNCPQYIQLREFDFVRSPDIVPTHNPQISSTLTDSARAMIEAADTFFVASYVDEKGERQVDASHRGGKPGFVRIDDDGTLTIPDFAGNFHFNTLGNFLINPRAGLLFVDFETGDILQLTGTAQVITDAPEIRAFQGAERIWTFNPSKVVLRRAASPLRWKMRKDAFSPNSLMTGSWNDTAAKLDAEKLAKAWRPLRIARIKDETSEIRSFYLEPTDGKGIANYKAGQHLPVRAAIEDGTNPTQRVYTLSSAPSDGFYRISVKRQGAFSDWLHSRSVGDILEGRGPSGAFYIDGTEGRAAVLIAAGVGATPMLAMLRQIVFEGKRRRGTRPTWFVHVARSRELRAFNDEVRHLVRQSEGAVRFIAVHDQPEQDEREGRDYSWAGRFSAADLSRFLPFGDYDFYMCGPPNFMQDTYDGLRGMGVADARVHAEAFGASSLRRSKSADTEAPAIPIATESVPVLFAGSAKEARWEPESGTLLELAEQRGLEPEFSCRSGSCGTCKVKILQGKVAYETPPTAETEEDEALICCASPAQSDDSAEGKLILDL
jgi:ferredoxin-NADP reductase/predicted pyridoxine 5'-phosphate oxidase superfamily flavin-nucleotide-binding protein